MPSVFIMSNLIKKLAYKIVTGLFDNDEIIVFSITMVMYTVHFTDVK